MAPRQLTHDDYTVGWLCVLDCELDAARASLDEEDDSLPPGLNDDNTYLLGRIGRHNVVITCPESYGTSPAIQTVTNMVRTFPRIRFGLMVGVGGGVPKVSHSQNSRKDLRLGDVVVAEPRGNHGGVIQYDLGKWKDNNEFVIESHLNKPPAILLKAMKQLKGDHRFGKGKMLDYMREVLEKLNDLPDIESFGFPGRGQDVLFNVEYAHVGGDDCSQCDVQHSENRIQRVSENPVIHYGLIASGNAVMRSAKSRDELRDSHDVFCFEMEAAGLMNYFPCIVIRGICDYSDGHKNKQWQPYAAVAAATYAKDLLRVIHPEEVVNLEIAAEIIKEFTETISNVNTNVSKMRTVVDNDFRDKVLQWLSPIDYGHQQSETLSRREAGTGQWLLGSDEFQEWIKNGKQTLFCPGIQGAGKTIMSSIVIDYLNSEYGNSSDVGIAYVYCSYRSKSQHKPIEILLSVLKQLTRGRQELSSEIKNLYVKHTNMGTRPKESEIVESLISVTNSYSRTFFIIDALDEHYSLDPGSLNSLLAKIFHVQENSPLSVFATSRDIPEITSQFNDCLSKEILAQNDDILCFVNGHMSNLCPSQISKFPMVQDLVRNTIIEAARGMFLLANLHMESLLGQPTIGDLEEALKELPSGESRLDDTYLQAVERIGNQREGLKNLARRTLTWLTYSKRALSLSEIQHAFAVRGCSSFLDEKFIPDPGTLGSICAGLVIVDQKNESIDFMHYTTKEYFERTGHFSEEMIDISTTCITYLSLEVFNDGFCLSDRSFYSRIHDNPVYIYAVGGSMLRKRQESQWI